MKKYNELFILGIIIAIISIVIWLVFRPIFDSIWMLVISFYVLLCFYYQAQSLLDMKSPSWRVIKFCSHWYIAKMGDTIGYCVIFFPHVTGVAAACFLASFVGTLVVSPFSFLIYQNKNLLAKSHSIEYISDSNKIMETLDHKDTESYQQVDSSNSYSNITNPYLTKFDFDLNVAVFEENRNIVARELRFELYRKKKSPNFLYKKHNAMVDAVERAYNDLLKNYTREYSIDTESLKKISRKYKEYVGCGELIEMYHGASAAAKGNFNFDGKAFARSVTLNDAVSAYKDFYISIQGVKYYPLACTDSYMLFCYHDNGCRKYKLIYNCSDYQSEVIIQKNELAYYNMFFEGKYVDYTEKTTLAPGPDFMKRYTYYANALGYLNESLEKDLTTYFNI